MRATCACSPVTWGSWRAGQRRRSRGRRSPTGSAATATRPERAGRARAAGSADRLLAPLPLLLAQDELLHLARGGAGQLAELDRARALEARQPLLGERDDLVLVGVLALL